MKEIVIDCAGMESPRQLHSALAEALNFPEWYGNNLNALHDCLTDISEPVSLTIKGIDELGIFAGGFCRVLEDSQEENPNLTFQTV